MDAKKADGKPSLACSTNSSPKGKNVGPQYRHPSGASDFGNNSSRVDQLSCDVADINLGGAQDGEWEVLARKSKNRGGTGAAKPWGSQTSAAKAWGHPDTVKKLGIGGTGKAPSGPWKTQAVDSKRPAGRGNAKPHSSNRGWENADMAPPLVRPPLQHGWQWANRASSQSKVSEDDQSRDILKLHMGSARGEDSGPDMGGAHQPGDVDDNDSDGIVDDTDDDILSDEFDSDESQKSHETRKKSNWFKAFFEALDNLTIEQINEPSRQWHCPACKNGPGAIDWYRGLQPLMTHAKTKGAKRVKLHRDFAELLDEELHRRGTAVVPAGEAFGKWKGLQQMVTDREIVWPPMVVIMNTRLERDENDQWIGMGNPELLDYFSSYAAVKAQHSYGPEGHRGMSVLIFDRSEMGYLEAERLDKHFSDEGTDRDAWDRRRMFFSAGAGGKRQLYGYMACKEDLDIFNQHSQGKSKLKFEMRSYREMVVCPMKQRSEDKPQLIYLKNEVAKERRNSKALQESFGVVTEKLRKTIEENHIVRQRTKMQHEQNKEEMDYQEQFFKDQISSVQNSLEEKEIIFEKQLQEEREKVQQSNADSRTKKDPKLRSEEIARFIQAQDKGIEEFESDREKLVRMHEEKKTEMKKKHFQEEIDLEREFETAVTQLMMKYTLNHSKEDTAGSFQE